MSEKRQRNQQRRQRRKARLRPRPVSPDHLLGELAELATKAMVQVDDALDAEQWASMMMSTWRRAAPVGEAVDFAIFVRALEALGTARALAALRALDAVGASEITRAAGDRLAAAGVAEPSWAEDLGRSRPVAAALLEEPSFDDGVSVMVEFAEPDGQALTLSVYIDYNVGGLVKDVLLAERIADLHETMEGAPEIDRLTFRELGLGEARARVEAALYMLDHTLDPPVDEDVHTLRALIDARLRLLPAGFELPDTYVEMPQEERDALLADFLESPEGRSWRGDEDAEFAAQLAIDFGADYNYGGPLRWSPVVVEIFMLDWLARKITEEPAFFARVPEVLATWVSYACRRRGVPEEFVSEAVGAVEEYRVEMLETVGDPAAWGPAKVFFTAAAEAGVDLTDRAALERFMQQYNEGLAA